MAKRSSKRSRRQKGEARESFDATREQAQRNIEGLRTLIHMQLTLLRDLEQTIGTSGTTADEEPR